VDPRQIWALAQRLLNEGRSRAEVEDRVKELTLQATGHAMTLGQLETEVQDFPGEAAAKKLFRAIKAAPIAPKLVVRGLQEAFNLPEHAVAYLAEHTPAEVLDDLVDGVGAVARFIKEDVEEFGPGALIEAVGPIQRAGKLPRTKVFDEVIGEIEQADIVRLNRRTRGEDPFERTRIPGAEDRRRLNDPEGFEPRLNFNVTDTGDPEKVVASLPNRADFDIPRDRLYDLEGDPDGLVAAVQEELGNLQGTNLNVLERRIKEEGYAGFLEPPARAGDVNQRAVVFEDALPELNRAVEGEVVGAIERAPERRASRPLGEGVDEIFEESVRLADEKTPKLVRNTRAETEARDLRAQRAAGGRVEDTPFNVVDLTNEFGGSTVNPRNGRSLVGEDRWASSIGPEFEEVSKTPLTESMVEEFVRKHQTYLDENPDAMIGTWFDEENHRWEINITRLFDSQRDARNFGAANKQRAIMNLADPEFEAVRVGDSFANARLRARLDDVVPERAAERLRNFTSSLTPEELKFWEGMNADMRAGTLRHYSLMPEIEEGAALALMGAEAARWYQESAKPLIQMFGTDSPRFLAVTAALSPNAPVDKSFYAALDFWADWEQAGRPRNREWVEQTLDRLKKEHGVTPTNANNLERSVNVTDEALQEPGALERGGIFGKGPTGRGLDTPGATTFISGHKVDPFWSNLNGYLQRYVMDTHMKRVTGFSAQASATKRQVIGAQTKAREYAEYLTGLTGQTWTVAEVQAAQWAVAKNIKEIADLRRGKAVAARAGSSKQIPKIMQEMTGIPNEVLWTDEVAATDMGELSERIRNSPSLARFLHTPEAAPHLRRLNMEPPTLAEDMSKLGFLDDPQVRFGDVMDAAIRMAQTEGQSLAGLAAFMIGQGVLNKANGAELLDTIGRAAGMNEVSRAAGMDPQGTIEALQLLDEQPEADNDTARRFGLVRGRPRMETLVGILQGSSQAAEGEPGGGESTEALQDSVTAIAGGGRFVESRVPNLVDILMPKQPGTQTAGMVLDLPFLRSTARMDPEFIDDRGIVAHEGGHLVENIAPEEAAGINAALDNFIAGLQSGRRDELNQSVVNRPATDEALRQELFANLFKESLLTPDAPPSIPGTENVRQLFDQLINRKLNFPGIGR
jgi:hypothetical protein